MQANAEKFQLILFARQEVAGSLNIGGTAINSEPVVKLLGVSIDKALSFSNHITLLCQKAGRYIHVLSRMSNELTAEAKLLLYKSFILSHFNYCPLVWHFCGLGDLKKMEKVELRALRFVFNDFHASYCELRSRSGRPLLYTERLKVVVTEVFECIQMYPLSITVLCTTELVRVVGCIHYQYRMVQSTVYPHRDKQDLVLIHRWSLYIGLRKLALSRE